MRGRTFIVAIALICVSVGVAFCGENAKESGDSPEIFIRNLFKEHLAQYDNVSWFDNEVILSRYFDRNLTALFLEDRSCYKWTDELCSIDFDPIINAQDYDEKLPTHLQVSIVHSKSDIEAKVIFDNIGPRLIIFRIVTTDKGLRISDIMYGDGKYSIKALLLKKIEEAKKLKSN
jgi:hypothetical protein